MWTNSLNNLPQQSVDTVRDASEPTTRQRALQNACRGLVLRTYNTPAPIRIPTIKHRTYLQCQTKRPQFTYLESQTFIRTKEGSVQASSTGFHSEGVGLAPLLR
ncbi:unnamed protein product [Ixodes persulcatus]